MLGVAVLGLGVVCLVWLTQVSFATLWRVLGLALVVFGVVELVGRARGADPAHLLLLGVAAGQVVFVVGSPLIERWVRQRDEFRAWSTRWRANEVAKHHKPTAAEQRRYRMPD